MRLARKLHGSSPIKLLPILLKLKLKTLRLVEAFQRKVATTIEQRPEKKLDVPPTGTTVRLVGQDMCVNKPDCLMERKRRKRDTKHFFSAGMVIQFANINSFPDLIESIPSFQRDLTMTFQEISGKEETQQAAHISIQALLPVRHKIPYAESREAAYIPVVPALMFHVKRFGSFMVGMCDDTKIALLFYLVNIFFRFFPCGSSG